MRKSNSDLIVFMERKTRKEIIIKLLRHSVEEVVKTIDILEERYQGRFNVAFKTITYDNCLEFACTKKIMKSKINKNKLRTTLYYATLTYHRKEVVMRWPIS